MRILPTTLAMLIASSPAFAQNNEPITDQIIVKYRANNPMMLTDASPSNSIAQLQQVTDADITYIRTSANNTHILKVADQEKLQTVIKQLNQNPAIEYAEPDRIMWPTATPNDPEFSKQWHYSSSVSGINLPKAWDVTTGGADVVVAVIDTGILPDHPDLMNNLLPGYDFIKKMQKRHVTAMPETVTRRMRGTGSSLVNAGKITHRATETLPGMVPTLPAPSLPKAITVKG